MAFDATIFGLGCLGALAPEIVRLYKIRSNPRVEWTWFYFLTSCLFAGLGGTVAWLLSTVSYWAAFAAGAATPLILTVLLRDPDLERRERNQLPKEMRELTKLAFEEEEKKRHETSDTLANIWKLINERDEATTDTELLKEIDSHIKKLAMKAVRIMEVPPKSQLFAKFSEQLDPPQPRLVPRRITKRWVGVLDTEEPLWIKLKKYFLRAL